MNRATALALFVVAALFAGVLGFLGSPASAQKTGGEPPFGNSVEQRNEMVIQLKEIKELLKEQNALLKSGGLRVVVTLPEKR